MFVLPSLPEYNKALHPTVIPLRFITAGELGRKNQTIYIQSLHDNFSLFKKLGILDIQVTP